MTDEELLGIHGLVKTYKQKDSYYHLKMWECQFTAHSGGTCYVSEGRDEEESIKLVANMMQHELREAIMQIEKI